VRVSVVHEEIAIRRATRDDVAAIVAMYASSSLHGNEPVDADRTEAFAEIDADPKQMLCVAELGGRVVGTFHLTMLRYLSFGGARAMLVEAVHVQESERNRGIGETMMRFAIDEARRRGCQRVQLTSNKKRTDAHRFYERLGFTRSHEGFKLMLEDV
jgi:predicted N-acetyltransferase YhbS